jgi:hypothetical protein
METQRMDLQGYPPMPPPPPVQNGRQRSWFVGGTATALAVAVVASGYGLWTYGNADHLGILDDPAVTRVVEPACRSMASAVQQVPVPTSDAPPDQVAAAIRSQTEAVRTLTATVRALGEETLDGDHPAQAWLADWDTLIRLRDEYAADLVAGRPASFTLPTVDGVPITKRMSDPGPSCPVPPVLTNLRPMG